MKGGKYLQGYTRRMEAAMTYAEKVAFIKEHGKRRDFLVGGQQLMGADPKIYRALWSTTITVPSDLLGSLEFAVGERFRGFEEMFDERQVLMAMNPNIYADIEPYSPALDGTFSVSSIEWPYGSIILRGHFLEPFGMEPPGEGA